MGAYHGKQSDGSFRDPHNEQKILQNGAGKVSAMFTPTALTGKITSSATGATFARDSAASAILLQSLEVAGLEEFAVIAQGTSAANAIANLNIAAAVGTTGQLIRSGDSTAGGVAPDHIYGIAENTTHFAIADGVSGQVQIIMVTQGV